MSHWKHDRSPGKSLAIFAIVVLLAGGALVWKCTRSSSTDADNAVTASHGASTGSGGATATTRNPLPSTSGSAGSATSPQATEAEVGDPLGGALRGRVTNWSTGEPVDGAELTWAGGDGGATTIRSGVDGAFVLAPPAPTTFTLVTATAPGFLPYAPEYLHSPIRATLAQHRVVRGVVVFLFPTVDYHGLVVDAASKKPVAGVRVKLLASSAGEQILDKITTEWTTDKDGRFTFHAPDDSVLEAASGKQLGRAILDGNAQISHELVIALSPSTPPRDRGIAGRVIDKDKKGVPDAFVRAIPTEGKRDPVPRAAAFATTDAEGRFAIEGLDAGPFELDVEAEDYATKSVGALGGDRDVVVELDGGGLIAGVVTTADGAPVPAFSILAYAKTGMLRELALARSLVDATGAFSIRLPIGEYELVAAATSFAPSQPLVAKTGDTGVKIVLTAGAILRGTIVAAEDKSPLAYARIVREARGGGASVQPSNPGTVSRVDGTFELAGIPPGPLSITVGAGERHPKIESGMIAREGEALGPITIALTKLAPGETPKLELVGIGARLSADPNGIRVDGVIDGSGAQAAGMLAGDHIVSVDGQPVAALGLDGAITIIRGVEGTKVTLVIARGADQRTFLVERRKIKA